MEVPLREPPDPTGRAAVTLLEDLREYGALATGLCVSETQVLVGDLARGRALHAHLRAHGPVPPRPSKEPRRPRTVDTAPAPPAAPPPRTHVIFGDAHAAPDQDLVRFRAMGEIVRDEVDRARVAGGPPIVLVQIGDWYSFDSLCTHEAAARRAEGRVREEIAAGEAALEAFHVGYGGSLRPCDVEAHLVLGNHDVRVARLGDDAPWLDGLYSVGAAHEARGWTVTPYRVPRRIDGVRYQHDLPSTGGGRAIGGKFAAGRHLDRVRFSESVVVGHSHKLQYATEADRTGRRVHGIVCGAWLDHLEAYAGEDNVSEWWTGHVVLRGVRAGGIDAVEFHRRG